ncbi:MAG: MazG nucleotide pyrophosphohydrolase domain-containing protein [Oscillospiraceae bacterium]
MAANESACDIADELGDVLFSGVNTARKLHLDAEEVLSRACAKFIGRFQTAEQLILSDGLDITKLSPQTLDTYWQKAKSDTHKKKSPETDAFL